MTANKKEINLKTNNIIYVIEAFFLTGIAVFLSVISGMLITDITGFVCIIAASALIACVFFLTSPSVIVIAGIASFAITFTLNENLLNAFASMAYVIIGAFIYFGVKNKRNRTQITVRIAIVITVFYFLLIAASFMMETGTFYDGMMALTSQIDQVLHNNVESVVKQYTTLMLAQSSGAGTTAEEAAQAAYFVETYITELVMNFKAILPACFILYNVLIAYLSTSIFKSAYNIFIPMANPKRNKIKNTYWRIKISVVSSIIMTCALFFAILASKGDTVLPYIVLMNLIYILAPGFCVMGVYFVYDKLFKSRTGIIPAVLVISLIMLAFISPTIVIFVVYSGASVLMAVGLYSALIGDLKKFFEKAKKALLGDGSDDDDDDYID